MEFQPFGHKITEFGDGFPAFPANKNVGYYFFMEPNNNVRFYQQITHSQPCEN